MCTLFDVSPNWHEDYENIFPLLLIFFLLSAVTVTHQFYVLSYGIVFKFEDKPFHMFSCLPLPAISLPLESLLMFAGPRDKVTRRVQEFRESKRNVDDVDIAERQFQSTWFSLGNTDIVGVRRRHVVK